VARVDRKIVCCRVLALGIGPVRGGVFGVRRKQPLLEDEGNNNEYGAYENECRRVG
jgi:hypothetical protein